MASCESTGRELSFEWSHHRISSTDSKVRVTLQNSIKHSGSERVKGAIAWGVKGAFGVIFLALFSTATATALPLCCSSLSFKSPQQYTLILSY